MSMNHIVLLAFKDASKAAPLFAALGELRKVCGDITSYTFGPYSSDEGMNQGYTHAFTMVFTDAAARDAYLVHPEHEKVKSEFLPFVSQVVVFDYES